MSTCDAVTVTSLDGRPPDWRGKVRDGYEYGDTLVLVATDRISAYDWVNPVGIPGKGKLLNQLSLFWFDRMSDLVPNHVLSDNLDDMPEGFAEHAGVFEGRSVLVRRCSMLPIEFVVRGYLAGSGWREYRQHGTVCGIPLPSGLREAEKLPEPIYTPATKAESGHDINISPAEAGEIIGAALNDHIASIAIRMYERARDFSLQCGLILCDTKFEFGLLDDAVVLADELLTPDSSRFWPCDGYQPGTNPPSFDKQYVRDYLDACGWDKASPPPPLPSEVVAETQQKYEEAYVALTREGASAV